MARLPVPMGASLQEVVAQGASLRPSTARQLACFFKNASVFSLNSGTFSYSGACEQSSKMYSPEVWMPLFSRSANRVEVTMSWRPKVICVGTRILPELRVGVVGDHCIGLLDERIDRLLGAAMHEVGQGLDVVRFLCIQL